MTYRSGFGLAILFVTACGFIGLDRNRDRQTHAPPVLQAFRMLRLPAAETVRTESGLMGNPTETELLLAEAAKKVLKAWRPDNPGRLASFPSWESESGLRLIRSGWAFVITDMVPLPGTGNWFASVNVFPIMHTEDHRSVGIENHHIEHYTYRDGVLELLGQDIDPDRDPRPGLHGLIGH
jgi:hypothetical protein